MKVFLRGFLIVYLICLNITAISTAKASHVLGASISYRSLGLDTYEIFLNVFRDCSQSQVDSAVAICVSDSCGNTSNLILTKNLLPFVYGGDSIFPNAQTGAISLDLICPSLQWDSRCLQSSGRTEDVQRYMYSAKIVLGSSCGFWTFSHELPCCRAANRNVSSTNSVITTELSRGGRSFNNSPIFDNSAVQYVCAGVPTIFSLGAFDLDGDSLHYEFIEGFENYNCQTGLGIETKFIPPYSGANPIAGVSINPKSGIVTFTPTILGKWFVVIKVSEYDRQGVFLGSVIRDAVIIVNTCASSGPRIFSLKDGVSGWDYFAGFFGLLGDRRFKACLGDSISLIFKFSDPNKADSISINSEVTKLFPGSTFSFSSTGDTAVAVFNWHANEITQGTRYFEVNAFNDACPYRNFYSFNFGIEVDTAIFDSHFDLSEFVCRKKGEPTEIYLQGGRGTWKWNGLSLERKDPFYIDVSNFPRGDSLVIIEREIAGRCGSYYSDTVTVFTHLNDEESWAAGTDSSQNFADNLHHFSHDSNFGKDTFFVPRSLSNRHDTLLLNNLEASLWFDQIVPSNASFEIRYNADSIAKRFGYGVYRMETKYQMNRPGSVCAFSDTAFVFICDDSLDLTITESYILRPTPYGLDTFLTAKPSGYLYRWTLSNPSQSSIRMWDTTLNVINISELRRQKGFPISSVSLFAYERNSLGGPFQDTNRTCYFDNAEWSNALNVSEVHQNEFVKVYPNPTRSLIHIEANKQITGLRITNILGEDLGFKKWQAESHIISVDDLPAGLYFLELEFESRRKVLRFEKL